MTDRVVGTIHGIAGAHQDGRVLVVSHGGPIRAIHAAALNLDVHTYRRLRPVEPNARLSAVCYVQGTLTELCPATEIDALIERDQAERLAAAARRRAHRGLSASTIVACGEGRSVWLRRALLLGHAAALARAIAEAHDPRRPDHRPERGDDADSTSMCRVTSERWMTSLPTKARRCPHRRTSSPT